MNPGLETAESPSPRHEIDPNVLSEIGSLSFRARIVADSILHGMHRSRHHGSSVEFSEHKEYSPGDNLRHLDWRAYARCDRDYIKRFEDESHLRALLVLDTSASMGYRGQNPKLLDKLSYAKTCAGALSYVLARQGDAVGVATFAKKLEIRVPARARRGHLQELITQLERLEPNGTTALADALDTLAGGMSRRMIVILMSDLLDVGPSALQAIAQLEARRHDVVLFHVMDPDELDFPFEESTHFFSMEDDREVAIDARAIRQAYLQEVSTFLNKVETAATSAHVEYHLLRTDASPSRFLAGFLSRRASWRMSAK